MGAAMKLNSNRKRRKAYSYARFSDAEQIKGDSFRRQLALARAYADEKNLDLDQSLTFHDIGISAFRGRNAETGRLAQMLDAIRIGLIKKDAVILVESLDRISRQSARKALRIIEEIVESGVSVATLSDRREYTAELLDKDPLSLLLALLVFIRANEESDLKSKRISAVWEEKRSKAKLVPLTARCPGWLKLSSNKSHFILFNPHVKTIRWIVDKALKGHSSAAIVRELNQKNTPTISNGRPAKRWYACNIRRLLRHEALTGNMTPHKVKYDQHSKYREPLQTIEGYYPAIVSRTEFKKLQKILNQNRTNECRKSAYPVHNIIAHLGRCAKCKGAISFSNKSERGQYLVCRGAVEGTSCNTRPIRYWEVEVSLKAAICNLLAERIDNLDFCQKNAASELIKLLNKVNLDRARVNEILLALVEKIVILSDRGVLKIFWHAGTHSTVQNAFTPSHKRKWGDRKKLQKPTS